MTQPQTTAQRLALWLEAEAAVASGQSYDMPGGGKLDLADAAHISRQITRLQRQLGRERARRRGPAAVARF